MKRFKTIQLFLRSYLLIAGSVLLLFSCSVTPDNQDCRERAFNGPYENEFLNRVAFPMGGIGAGMITLEALFSFHAANLMQIHNKGSWWTQPEEGSAVSGIRNGFLLSQSCLPDKAHYKGDFAVFTDQKRTVTDLCWFRGGWFDSRTIIWKDVSEFTYQEDTTTEGSTGASIYVPVDLEPGEEMLGVNDAV